MSNGDQGWGWLIDAFSKPDTWNGAVVAMAGAFLFASLLLEHAADEFPCALCLTQRLLMMVAGLISLAGMVHSSRLGIYPVVGLLFVLGGAGYAIWHVLVMLIPDLSESCGPSLEYLVENQFGAGSMVEAMLKGTTSCAELSWIPFAAFAGFLALGVSLVGQLRCLAREMN